MAFGSTGAAFAGIARGAPEPAALAATALAATALAASALAAAAVTGGASSSSVT